MLCEYCTEPLLPHERPGGATVSVHEECLVRMILGSVAHQKRTCRCYGGSDHDELGLTKREAARLAAAYHFSQSSYPALPIQ